MRGRQRLVKEDDYETRFRCAGGIGILREEVWVDERGEVVRYNLALLLPHLFRADNGRVLGFDNAHGAHERHEFGEVSLFDYQSYPATAEQFYREAEALRRSYEDKGPARRV
jgi:hypothetical protein